jgi:prepilin-type N-terminal cleavage/methylation domain-containing protein
MLTFLQLSTSGSKRGTRAQPKGHRPRGFTLIELLVVSAIIVIITLVLLLRQSKFDSSTILRSAAYSIALSVRQAQVYGTSVLGSSNGGSIAYAPAYGLYFNITAPTSYTLFADFNNNQSYDAVTESIKVFSLNNGYSLAEACAKLSNGTNRCTGSDDSSGLRTTTTLTILFRRPNPDAVFTTDVVGESYTSAWVQVQSPDQNKRSLLVTAPGQITVQSLGTLP